VFQGRVSGDTVGNPAGDGKVAPRDENSERRKHGRTWYLGRSAVLVSLGVTPRWCWESDLYHVRVIVT
jgi:hypothetical protein